jgi:ribosomal protein L12E/L44/L45/RPP1/RPP2
MDRNLIGVLLHQNQQATNPAMAHSTAVTATATAAAAKLFAATPIKEPPFDPDPEQEEETKDDDEDRDDEETGGETK